ncbi:MAG: addiction module protein [Planctomycetota bacterium]
MTEIAEKLKAELSQLAEKDRAELAYYLIRSLDLEDEDEDNIQSAWEAELEQRWQDMETGTITGVPAEDVFAEMRKKYP